MGISQTVRDFRASVEDRFPTPTVEDSYLFLVSEMGEVADAYVRMRGAKYARNADRAGDRDALRKEIGQTLLMLTTFAEHFDIDMDDALRAAMQGILARARDE